MSDFKALRERMFQVIEQGPKIGVVQDTEKDALKVLQKKCEIHEQLGVVDFGHMTQFPLKIQGQHIEWGRELFDELYEHKSSAALYGNKKTGESEHDAKIRLGRDIESRDLTIPETAICDLQEKWARSKVLSPKEITIVPHKLNLYRRGDYFKRHVDTPEDNLLATMVVSVFCDESDDDTTALLVQNQRWKICHSWNSFPWCAFFTDVSHEVPKSAKNRATLTFKVFCKTKQEKKEVESEKLKLSQEIQELACKLRLPLGILLSHNYTVTQDVATLKGADAILLRAFQSGNFDLHWISVAVEESDHACSDARDCCEEDEESEAYQWKQVGDINVRYIRLRKLTKYVKMPIASELVEQDEKTFQIMDKIVAKRLVALPFYQWAPTYGVLWKENSDVEDSGNSGDYGDITKIYVTRALIVAPKIK